MPKLGGGGKRASNQIIDNVQTVSYSDSLL